ncbi:helix-turn-helix domain-containing protein [Mesorhizobium sp. M1380]|uniref:helix-turn-helix domain-containing protein n=1 Tax=Mesorhizobium sp. M1380 TaxID=2957093 RepID=UPI00333DED70
MESNLQEPIDLTRIANKVALSRRQLERRFATEIGVSPKSAYLAHRLQYAKFLLESSHLPVSEVAFRCGFVSLGNLSRSFRAKFGKSPSQLRGTAT